MIKTLDRRSEIIFLYDVTDSNPNGDPLNENRPRIDEETEINLVTDVRLKRSVRDYLNEYRKEDIFIREEKTEKGEQKTRTRRLGEFLCDHKDRFKEWDINRNKLGKMKDPEIEEKIDKKVPIEELEQALLESYVDLRLFGATIAVKGSTIIKIGPVQFKFGRSLHKVESKFVQGTTVMPSRAGVKAGTMWEMYILPYSLICFYGIANENAAKSTGLTDEDMDLLMDGLWNGTKNLLTRSKVGQIPRLLIRIEYNENNYHIGELDKHITINTDKPEKELRRITDLSIDLTSLISKLKEKKEKIAHINYRADTNAFFEFKGRKLSGEDFEDMLPKNIKAAKIDVKK